MSGSRTVRRLFLRFQGDERAYSTQRFEPALNLVRSVAFEVGELGGKERRELFPNDEGAVGSSRLVLHIKGTADGDVS
jgi:hypothetical protein